MEGGDWLVLVLIFLAMATGTLIGKHGTENCYDTKITKSKLIIIDNASYKCKMIKNLKEQ